MNRCEFGKSGESFAADCLKTQGFSILARNFRVKTGEIDLIAFKNRRLYFFEVKTYQSRFVAPELRITTQKVQKMQRVAQIFISRLNRQAATGCCFELLKVNINDTGHFTGISRIPISL